jgi:RimJ/RimL family protein N-acetyltransferase
LIGSIEVNLARILEPGQVNVSYGIFQEWRGRGLALRALDLMSEYLLGATDVRQMVLRIAPANTASLGMAEKAGFAFLGVFDEPEGSLARYVRDVK